MKLEIEIPDSHAAEILAANASTFKAKRLSAAIQSNKKPDEMPGTDKEVIEAMLFQQLKDVTKAVRARNAAIEFEKELK